MEKNLDDYLIKGSCGTDMPVELWDVIAGWPREQQIGFFRGNTLKYLMRMDAKTGASVLEDARHAEHYLHQLITTLETDA